MDMQEQLRRIQEEASEQLENIRDKASENAGQKGRPDPTASFDGTTAC